MNIVNIVDKNGKSLMPTNRFGKVRRLLKDNKAKIIKRTPFTIQLLYELDYEKEFNDMKFKYKNPSIDFGEKVDLKGNIILSSTDDYNRESIIKYISEKATKLDAEVIYLSYLRNLSQHKDEFKAVDLIRDDLKKVKEEYLNRLSILEQNSLTHIGLIGNSLLPYKYIIIDDYDTLIKTNNYKALNDIHSIIETIGNNGSRVGLYLIIVVKNIRGSALAGRMMSMMANQLLIGPVSDVDNFQLMFDFIPNTDLKVNEYMVNTPEISLKTYCNSVNLSDYVHKLPFISQEKATENIKVKFVTEDTLNEYHGRPLLSLQLNYLTNIVKNTLICGNGNTFTNLLNAIKSQFNSANHIDFQSLSALDSVITKSNTFMSAFNKYYNKAISDYRKNISAVDKSYLNLANTTWTNFNAKDLFNNPKSKVTFKVLLITNADCIIESDQGEEFLKNLEMLCRISYDIGLMVIVSCTKLSKDWFNSFSDFIENFILVGPFNKDNFTTLYNDTLAVPIDAESFVCGSRDSIDEHGHYTLKVFNVKELPNSTIPITPIAEASKAFSYILSVSTSSIIIGPEGSGKTTVLNSFKNKYANTNCINDIIDIKCHSNETEVKTTLKQFLPLIGKTIVNNQDTIDYSEYNTISDIGISYIIKALYEKMMERFRQMELAGVNAYNKLKDIHYNPIKVFIDDLDKYLINLDYNIKEEVISNLCSIIKIGRAAGIRLYITATSLVPINKYLLNSITHYIVLGKISPEDQKIVDKDLTINILDPSIGDLPNFYGRTKFLCDPSIITFSVSRLDEILTQVVFENESEN